LEEAKSGKQHVYFVDAAHFGLFGISCGTICMLKQWVTWYSLIIY